jgi:curved DNA-binding protein CbpA
VQDHYQVLGLSPSSSGKDIKKAFRDRAKRLHPDVAGGGNDASGRMRALLEAYETLSDPELRREYDIAHKRAFKRFSFDYRTFLKSRPGDPVSGAKLVFYDILHGWEDEAIEVYDAAGIREIGLDRLIEREDAMDCAFLLAEEYERRGRYREAFEGYEFCIRREMEKPYFRHFLPEIRMRIKELARVRLPREASEEELLGYLSALAALGFPRKENARFLRHRAEINVRLGRLADARDDLVAAISLDKKLSGIAHLRKWTGIE